MLERRFSRAAVTCACWIYTSSALFKIYVFRGAAAHTANAFKDREQHLAFHDVLFTSIKPNAAQARGSLR